MAFSTVSSSSVTPQNLVTQSLQNPETQTHHKIKKSPIRNSSETSQRPARHKISPRSETVLELCLKNNHFIKPPDEIWAMKNLVVLNLSGNCLSALPVRIGSLYALQVLDASHNEIKTLHESLGNLTDLRTLNLNSNRLRTLAPGVLPKSLEQLYVEKNLFTQFPQAIHQLPNIVVVSVAKNKIKPADLKEHLQRLEGPDDSENTTSSSSSNHSTSTGNSPENESQKKDDPIAEVTTAFQELMPPSSGMN